MIGGIPDEAGEESSVEVIDNPVEVNGSSDSVVEVSTIIVNPGSPIEVDTGSVDAAISPVDVTTGSSVEVT